MKRYIAADDRAEVQRTIDRAIAARSLFELEHRVGHADGGLGWRLSRAVPILGDRDEVEEWLGAGRRQS